VRWGLWYPHDGGAVIHRSTALIVEPLVLEHPVELARWVLANADRLTASDVVHLQIAANELQHEAWCFDGVGDWTNGEGEYAGEPRTTEHRVA